MTSERLAFGLLFLVLGVLACLAPAQSDTWWLLRAGQDIWQTGTVPMVDTYSHTATGRYWPNHEWLTEATFYALVRLGGMPLLAAVCAAAMLFAWGRSFSLARGSFEVRFLLLIACVIPAAGSFALRPQVFTMAFFALTCWLLTTRREWWVPVVVLIWANFHGAVALGLVATFAVTGATLFVERRIPWSLAAASALSAAATALTPMGTGLWRFWIESPARSDANQLIEWLPPDLSVELWPFWVIVVGLPLAALLYWRRLDPQTKLLVAVAVGVTPLALQAIRNVHVYLLAALPAMANVLAVIWTARPPPRGENLRLNGGIFAATATLSAIFVGLVWMRPPDRVGWSPVSTEAAAAVRACPDPLFNTYGGGGELIWFVPGKLVFIDNRQDPYPMDLLAANHDVEVSGADPTPLFMQYGIRCAVLPADSVLVSTLTADSAWSQMFVDDDWVVLQRPPHDPP